MLKIIKPTTPSLRHKIQLINSTERLKNKTLSLNKRKTGGRNFLGKITRRHLGGGHKQRIKIIDNHANVGAYSKSTIKQFIYDPNRSNYLALYQTLNNKEFLKLAPDNQKIGDIIYGKHYPGKKSFNIGNAEFLKNISTGTKIFNIELFPGSGMKLAKAAGVFAIIIKHNKDITTIKLASKKTINLSSDCLAHIGINSNLNHNNTILGKAGVKRWLGIRPTVRGEAMNPIDHPHGGETSGGVKLKTIYGKLAKFIKTR